MITISIMLANIMQDVDNTILNVALPHIQGSLSASLDQIRRVRPTTKPRSCPSRYGCATSGERSGW